MTSLAVEIARSDGDARRHFAVEIAEPAVVLDVLLALQRTDASIAFRYSCRVAMCGTCAIRVDGRPALACHPSRETVESGLDCIGCGACWTACDLAGAEHGFVGPAALNRAMTLAGDARDGARGRRLELVSREGGVTRCHYIHGCSGACPKGLDPAASIRRLRRWSVGAGR
jgi:succinate dehydrogenase/fumarate reductase-like Fe-S protein